MIYSDPSGHFPFLIALILGGFAIAGGIIGGKVSYDNAVNAGKTGAELVWSTIGGIFIGVSAGLATAGLIVSTIGIIHGAIYGISTIIPYFGMTSLKTFVLGAIPFNQFAFITAPLLGLQIDGIEL